MDLYYHNDIRGNFGDDLNFPYFNAIAPGFEHAKYERLVGIGTLLNDSLGVLKNSIVFGSGYGQGHPATIDFQTTKVLGVRGPRTALSLELDPQQYVIGDPALYLPKIESLNTGSPIAQDCIVVALHHRTAELWSFPRDESNGIVFLDPGEVSIVDYIATIKSAKYVVAEAMHGAIVSAAYDIPFLFAQFLGKTDQEKWLDLYASLELDAPDPVQFSLPNQPTARQLTVKVASSLRKKSVLNLVRAPSLGERYLDEVLREIRASEVSCRFQRAPRGKLDEFIQKTELAICRLQKLIET